MLDLYTKYQKFINQVLQKNHKFLEALDRAFKIAVNYKVGANQFSRAPQLLAKYCDGLLNKNLK